jgi:homoserine acetyltransferase
MGSELSRLQGCRHPNCPTARTHRQGNYAWEGVRQTVLLDPKWRDGNYPNDDPPRQGLAVGLQIQSILGSSAPGYEASFTNQEEVLAAYATDVNVLAYRLQPRDWIYRSWAIQGHDISRGEPFNGDLAAAAVDTCARSAPSKLLRPALPLARAACSKSRSTSRPRSSWTSTTSVDIAAFKALARSVL